MLGALGEKNIGKPFLNSGEEGVVGGGEGFPRARAGGGEYPGHGGCVWISRERAEAAMEGGTQEGDDDAAAS